MLVGAALLLLARRRADPDRGRAALYAVVTAAAAIAAGVLAIFHWDDITDGTDRSTLVGGAHRLRHVRRCSSRSRSARPSSASPCRRRLPAPRAVATARRSTPSSLVAAAGGVVMAVGQRPDRAVPRAGDAVARASTCSPRATGAARRARRAASSTSSSAGSRRRSSSTASPSSTARPARPTSSTIVDGVQQHDARRAATTRCVLAGIALLLVGLGFKVAAVPFHVWTPDVYQGAPTPVTALMASVGKAAAFAAMLRVLVVGLAVLPRRLAAGRLGAGRAVAGGRLGAGRRADRRQADARLLVDQPRRVHPRRASRPPATAPASADTGAGMPAVLVYLLAYAVLVDRHVRRRRRSSPAAATGAPTSTRSAGSASSTRRWRWRSPCSSSPRPACRSRAGSSPSSA